MYKIGLSSCGKIINEELFAKYKKSGLGAMELAMKPADYKDFDYATAAELAKKYDIVLWSMHLPIYPDDVVDIISMDPSIRKGTIDYYEDLIAKASKVGVKRFICHPGKELASWEGRDERIKNSKESLNLLAEVAHKYGSVICVEDLPRMCLGNTTEAILDLISVNDKLRVCFDVNHLLKDDAVDFIRAVGDRLETVHISDFDKIDERHWMPGEGVTNWVELYETLKEVNYQGVWMYEIDFECPDTVERPRDLICEDFVENAKQIFAGKTPERIK